MADDFGGAAENELEERLRRSDPYLPRVIEGPDSVGIAFGSYRFQNQLDKLVPLGYESAHPALSPTPGVDRPAGTILGRLLRRLAAAFLDWRGL